MVSWEGRRTESSLRAIERSFVLRSMRELRFWRTLCAPPGLALFAFGYHWWGWDRLAAFFAAMAVLSTLQPIVMLVARPWAAGRAARRVEDPTVHVQADADGVTITSERGKRTVRGSTVRHVWESEQGLTLVVTPYVAVHLPKAGASPEVLDAVRQYMRGAQATAT